MESQGRRAARVSLRHAFTDIENLLQKAAISCIWLFMANTQRAPLHRPGSNAGRDVKQVVTLRLDLERFRKLELLARAENRTPTNYAETALLRDMDAKEEAARVITMFVPGEAAALVPGELARTEGESDERYAERSALMDSLFAIPDAE